MIFVFIREKPNEIEPVENTFRMYNYRKCKMCKSADFFKLLLIDPSVYAKMVIYPPNYPTLPHSSTIIHVCLCLFLPNNLPLPTIFLRKCGMSTRKPIVCASDETWNGWVN
jgi:hypothetical protein